MLDANNTSASLPAGYYTGGTIGTELPPDKTITYLHHVHSTSSITETVSDNSFDSGVAYGEETSTIKGGCYTKKGGLITRISVQCNDRGGEGSPGWYEMSGICGLCGRRVSTMSLGGNPTSTICPYCSKYEYKADCGYVSGQVLEATVKY